MQFLLLLFLMLPCLPEKWSPAVWEPSPSSSGLLTWAGIGFAVLFAAFIAHRLCRQLRRVPEQRETLLRSYNRFRFLHTITLFGIYFTALYGFGWGWTVQAYLGHPDSLLPGAELIVLAPFFAGLMGSWACFYDAERAIHLTAKTTGDSEREGSRWRYVLFHIRQNVAFVFLPIIGYILAKALCGLLRINHEVTGFLVGISITFGIVALFPLLLRLVLGLQPMPDGPLRDRLLCSTRALGAPCTNIFVWKTRGNIANAMILGILPWLRYIIYTDHLLDNMTPEEVEAVFGHELGHVKHRHMLFYMCFLLMSVLAMCVAFILGQKLLQGALEWLQIDLGNASASLGDQWMQLPPLVLIGAYIFIVFGFVSRRCESQADIYGCRAVSCSNRHCQGHEEGTTPIGSADCLCPTGISIFISALEKVASLNGISRDRPGWLHSWSHGTIADRIDFLENVSRDLKVERRFQRRVALVKVGMIFGLIAFLTVAGMVAGWEILLSMG
jgi:Zn-dependent protease with chaperone function